MLPDNPESAAREQRILIRNARQLLTLQGASGPRRGAALSELNVIPNGALLIRNGVIEEVGPARRIENLAAARGAREVDASGRIVMPAFIDPDAMLVSPPPTGRETADGDDGEAIRVVSRKNVELRAAAAAAERARYGCLTAGAGTSCATDLRNVIKVLRAHRALQSRPLRIRSLFSYCPVPVDELIASWLPAIRKDKLASVVEFSLGGERDPEPIALREAAISASGAGFAIRIRSARRPDPATLLLALSCGAISLVAPMDALHAFTGPLASIGCVRVIPASDAFDNASSAPVNIRNGIGGGAALALSPGYRLRGVSSFNMQFMLYLAVRHFGMSDEEAIVATTYNAACSLRLSHVTGSLEPGKSADLLMMEAPDYRELARRAGHHDVSLVMRAGQVVFRRAPLMLD